MTDPRDLRFPSMPEGDDADLVSRLQISYAATPVPPAAHAARVAQAIVERAARDGLRDERGGSGERGHPRWWWGMAAAAALVVLVLRPWRDPSGADGRNGAAGAPSASTLSGATVELAGAVRFDLTLPTNAKQVALVGDFNGWSETATPMVRRGRDGTWSASVPLPPGRHTYAFVVDGTRWLVDPLAPQVAGSDFGPTNAVIVERGGSERPDSGTEP